MESGAKLGRYEIRKKIGAGGMGEVFLAQDLELDRPAALKVLPAEFCCNLERVQRFKQEARAASALNHPNIITIYEIAAVEERLRRRNAQAKNREKRFDGFRCRDDCRAGRVGAGGRARSAHQASRHQAGKYNDSPRRLRQDSGFRAGEIVG
jgi:hypothetical protein